MSDEDAGVCRAGGEREDKDKATELKYKEQTILAGLFTYCSVEYDFF